MKERPNESTASASFEFEALRHAHNYRRALLQEFTPYLSGRVIEIGAGVGQFTEMIISCPGVKEVVAVEPEPGFHAELRQRIPAQTVVAGTSENLPPGLEASAIVCVNVLEHIRDHEAELKRFAGHLRARHGYLCLFVPARQEIYAPLDKDFGHHRRYDKPGLRQLLQSAGFEIEHLHYYNWLGYFAWWASFCLLKKRHFDVGSVKLYDRYIFPAVHWSEAQIMRPPFGQSLMAVARVTA
jgi:SAM-dependent methyltransferase